MVSLIGRKATRSDAERGPADEEPKDETAQMEQEEEDEDAEMRLSTGDDDDEDDEDEDDDAEQANGDEDHHQPVGLNGAHQRRQHRRARRQKEQAPNGARVPPFALPPPPPSAASPECGDLDEPDVEQLKRILAGKRLSEGNCNRHLANHLANICRKNSLHLIGESLPPVTEGEPMRHMSHHMSQSIEGGASSSHSNSTSSSSLRGGNVRHLAAAGNKRNSQDENMATSCSSSTSLDGSSAAQRSPTRRRSSTVSQCSSVLSEGTRQQLNFDLSPDLAPDSSILEANAISPTDYDRPASPEPSSLDSMGDFDGSSSFDMRPVSRLSDNWAQFNSEEHSLMAMTVTELDRSACSPDEPQKGLRSESLGHLLTATQQVTAVDSNSETTTTTNDDSEKELRQRAGARPDYRKRCTTATSCGEVASLEQIITNVSEVKVSSDGAERRRSPHELGQQPNGDSQRRDHLADSSAGTKRAHTPFGANIQRSKATHIESGLN